MSGEDVLARVRAEVAEANALQSTLPPSVPDDTGQDPSAGLGQAGAAPGADLREPLGRAAFGAHVSGLAEQEEPPWQDRPPAWEELSGGDREFYMRIGHAVADYALTGNAVTWGTDCASCAKTLDHAYAETVRAEAAEETLAALRSVLLEGGQPDATARRRALAIIGSGEAAPPSGMQDPAPVVRVIDEGDGNG